MICCDLLVTDIGRCMFVCRLLSVFVWVQLSFGYSMGLGFVLVQCIAAASMFTQRCCTLVLRVL